MGCLYSKNDVSELHPNVFRVVNIDENGRALCSGKLEITDSDIILYREGRDSTVWPLHSLRRYGFEKKIFSFESGRRCETGEGIYAFRCHRAAMLFRTLQQRIQLRNVVHESLTYPMPQPNPSPQMGATGQHPIDNGAPISGGIGIIHSNNHQTGVSGLPQAITQSPRSPSSAEILEVMALNPHRQTNSNHATNIYHLRNFKREHNNNQSESAADTQHVYCNDINRDLAILRRNLRQETALNTMRDIEYETRFLESRYVNEAEHKEAAVSPTLSNNSEHYAQLSIEQQQQLLQQKQLTSQQLQDLRLYMNVTPLEDVACTADHNKNDGPLTPLTPKSAEYTNFGLSMIPEINTYANFSLGELAETLKNAKSKVLESNAAACVSPVEDLVNYAVLDIDSTKEMVTLPDLASPESQSNNSSRNESTTSYSSHTRGRLVSQTSLEKPLVANASIPAPLASIGYTTIDFDKTVALTSVAADKQPAETTKTSKNNSNTTTGSPSTGDKKTNN